MLMVLLATLLLCCLSFCSSFPAACAAVFFTVVSVSMSYMCHCSVDTAAVSGNYHSVSVRFVIGREESCDIVLFTFHFQQLRLHIWPSRVTSLVITITDLVPC